MRRAASALLLAMACGKAVSGETAPGIGGESGIAATASGSGGFEGANGGTSAVVGGGTSSAVSGSGGDRPDGTVEGGASDSNGGDCNPQLVALIRDFKSTQSDFENQVGVDPGIVMSELGDDRKPIFAWKTFDTVHSGVHFEEWFHDEPPDVNVTFQYVLGTPRPDQRFWFFDDAFFPIDDRGFGNQGNTHNFHYTFELHARFRYHGGETFSFAGNDDVFVFVNQQLALDLGGVHDVLSGNIDFDQSAAELGLNRGGVFDFDFFRAQRHTPKSVFRFSSTLDFVQCTPILLH